MTLQEAIEMLQTHQDWRKELHKKMKIQPKTLTTAIDIILEHLTKTTNQTKL